MKIYIYLNILFSNLKISQKTDGSFEIQTKHIHQKKKIQRFYRNTFNDFSQYEKCIDITSRHL